MQRQQGNRFHCDAPLHSTIKWSVFCSGCSRRHCAAEGTMQQKALCSCSGTDRCGCPGSIQPHHSHRGTTSHWHCTGWLQSTTSATHPTLCWYHHFVGLFFFFPFKIVCRVPERSSVPSPIEWCSWETVSTTSLHSTQYGVLVHGLPYLSEQWKNGSLTLIEVLYDSRVMNDGHSVPTSALP